MYNSFQLPTANGSLHYAISASDRVTLGYDGSNQTANFATLSADAGYLSASIVHPFQLTYAGGYSFATNGQPSAFFQDLSLTQTYNTKYWKFTLGDSIRYLPQSSSTGLSGIPGVGDVGVTGTDPSDDILTPYATRVSNDSTLDVSRVLTGSTSVNGTFYYSVERFLSNSNGIESNDLALRGSVTHRVDALTSLSADYSYSNFSYVQQDGAFLSQTVVFEYSRKLTRKLDISGGAGPEYVNSSALTGRSPYFTYSVRAHVSYIGNPESGGAYSLSYTRATSSGTGTTFGTESDNLAGSASHRFTRSLQGSAEAHYTQSSGLQFGTSQPLNTKTVVASLQANRAISRTVSIFASYSLQHQIYDGTYQGIAPLNGLSQTLSFGLTYSPSQILLGRQ